MTLRKKLLPNLALHVLLFFCSLYMLVQNIADPGTVQLLFVGSAVCMGWYAARHVPFPSLFHWFILCYVALFYFYPILLPSLNISFKAADHVVAGYCLMTAGGIHLFIVTYELFRKTAGLKDPKKGDVFVVDEKKFRRVVLILVGVNILGALLMIVDAGSVSISTIVDMMNTARHDRKLESGALSLLGAYLIIFGGLVFVLIPVYARKRLGQTLILAGILVVFDLFLMIAFRARTPIVLHLIAVSVGFLYMKHRIVYAKKGILRNSKNKLKAINSRKILFRMAFFILAVGVLSLYMRIVRGYIGNASDLSFLKQDLSVAVEYGLAVDSAVGGDLGYTPTVFKVIEFVPEHHDYLGGQSYYRLLFIGIPRFIWRNKPENTGIIVGRWIFPGTIVQSNPPGIMGDMYINFGFVGILGFCIFGFIFARIDNSRTLAYYLIVATSFGLIFHLARGSFTNTVLQFVILYIAAYGIQRYVLAGERVPVHSSHDSYDKHI